MKRKTEVFLSDWRQRANRKPLVLRGARQVGKTYLVEHWGKERFRNVLTVDLLRDRDLHGLFAEPDPKRLLAELARRFRYGCQGSARPDFERLPA